MRIRSSVELYCHSFSLLLVDFVNDARCRVFGPAGRNSTLETTLFYQYLVATRVGIRFAPKIMDADFAILGPVSAIGRICWPLGGGLWS